MAEIQQIWRTGLASLTKPARRASRARPELELADIATVAEYLQVNRYCRFSHRPMAALLFSLSWVLLMFGRGWRTSGAGVQKLRNLSNRLKVSLQHCVAEARDIYQAPTDAKPFSAFVLGSPVANAST